MTKDIISMAREAGIDSWWDSGSELREVFDDHLTRFATLVKAARDAELLEGVEMPFEYCREDRDIAPSRWHTPEQLRSNVAAAVAKTNAAWQVVNQVREEVTDELRAELAQRDAHIVEYNTRIQAEVLKLLNEKDALKAENERLRADAARYQWLRRTQVELSLNHDTVAGLVRDVTELDAAMKGQP